jgi:ATP-dependent DNA ligase
MPKKEKARFIEPMLLLRRETLPEGEDWITELKLDGFRSIAFKTGGKIHLRSRNDNDFSVKCAGIVKGLAPMPDETVLDGEVVALDPEGRPSFNLLQNAASGAALHYFIFDVLILKGKDVMGETLEARRALLEKHVFPKMEEPIRYSPMLVGSLKDLIRSVKASSLEGLVAKRRDRKYEPGLRTGAWQKMRVNQGRSSLSAGTRSAVPRSTPSCSAITRTGS